jgi:hypothetical protein
MPMNRALYPAGWEAFSVSIRVGRALHRCECTGECGLHLPVPDARGQPGARLLGERRCLEVNKQRARYFNGRVMLTTAHLCNCYPICANPAHVKAMCQRCHLRVDMYRHRDARLRTVSTPSYKSQRYRKAGKAFHVEDLDMIMKLPQCKRRRPWVGLL